jgi:hypothetical protein
MSEGSKAPSSSEVEKLGGAFVDTPGILDIIVGSLFLYLIRLWGGAQILGSFPSTGFPIIDGALLGFGAALAGKVISIAVATVMAAVLVLNEGLQTTAHQRLKTLRHSLRCMRVHFLADVADEDSFFHKVLCVLSASLRERC